MTCHETQDKVLKVIESCKTAHQLTVAKRYAQRWIDRLLQAAANDDFLSEYAYEVQQTIKRHERTVTGDNSHICGCVDRNSTNSVHTK